MFLVQGCSNICCIIIVYLIVFIVASGLTVVQVTHPEANIVNAPSLAKAAGVKASFSSSDSSNVAITVSGEGDNIMTMTGCVCGDKAFLTGNLPNTNSPCKICVFN